MRVLSGSLFKILTGAVSPCSLLAARSSSWVSNNSYPYTDRTDLSRFTAPVLVVAVVSMQHHSNASLWPRISQKLYAFDEISMVLYSCVASPGSIISSSKPLGPIQTLSSNHQSL